ncbi:MAG: prepilin peptidase [Peptoniphilaceae bacterium]|uniref:prepilin peptidase n=1 Tax=Parvimonas sp. TaxID=1944660 RepID=UPI0025F10C61|nr:prepilin peptidase [Parvimonas sp.]MCI5997602.1 prepilin peptidase [Parvimonas sp.]MDD7765197.1 prepilin peptidase [Peptoniphilaceae bacterium]MDY3051186.1 prepilin peptidase [Parvimonas sp.]
MYIVFAIISLIVGIVFSFTVPVVADLLVKYKKSKRLNGQYVDNKPTIIFSKIFPIIIGFIVSYLSLSNFPVWKVVFLLVFAFIACIGTLVDNRIRIISNEMILFMLFLGIIYRFFDGGLSFLINSTVSAVGMFAFLLISFFVIGKFMSSIVPAGAGDLKLMMILAFLVGYPNLIISVFVTMVTMLIYIIIGLIMKKITFKSYIPMAGFIMIGIIVGLFSGGIDLWKWISKIGLMQ